MEEQAVELEPIEDMVIDGVVKSIEEERIVVGLGARGDGTVDVREFRDQKPSVGDQLRLFVEKRDPNTQRYSLSKEKADRLAIWDRLVDAFDKNMEVEGVIVAPVDGGFSVDVGVKAFLPASQVDLQPVRDVERWLDQKLNFRIIKFHKNRNNIVVSRRVLLEEARARTIDKIKVGAVLDGTVKNLTDYGAFIELGGIQGLLHVSDMSWGRVTHPSDIVDVGDMVRVKVLKWDPETQKISLGLRQLQEDPWADASARYAPGTKVQGRVVAITDYGLFLELDVGVEGLLHTTGPMIGTQEARELIKRTSIGDTIDAVVLETDVARKRISLGLPKANG
jgi:small subunit ribosomal protein S1